MESYLKKKTRYDILKAQLDLDYYTFLPQFRDLNDYILPTRGRFFISDNNRGDRRNHKIHDPTAYLAARTLASGMMAGITSPARPWFKLSVPDPDLTEFGPVKDWLHAVSLRMTSMFLKTNLYQVLPDVYQDLGVFGTAAFLMEDDLQDVSRYYSLPIGTYRLGKDDRGKISVFFREFRMTVRQLVEKFGNKDPKTGKADWSNFSTQVKSFWDRAEYETWIDVTHVIEPNQSYDPRKPLDPKSRKFSSCYYERGTSGQSTGSSNSVDYDRFLRESGYDYFPILAPRWQITGNDVYGTNCPGMVSIGDVKQLQHGEKRSLQAIDKMVNPPMKAPASMKNGKSSILPGDVTYVDERDGAFTPAHEVRMSIQELEGKQSQVRDRIRRTFFEDLFLMLANDNRSNITATEIMERKEEKLLAIGPVLEQLNQDVLDPLIDNKFYLMNQAGLIPEAPEELQGADLKVEYISVMAQAQKMIGISGIERLANFAGAIMDRNPDSAIKVDFDQMIDEYAEALGVSPRIIRSDETVEEMRAAQARAQQAQAQAENLAKTAGAAKNLSQAETQDGNALDLLLERAKAGELAPGA